VDESAVATRLGGQAEEHLRRVSDHPTSLTGLRLTHAMWVVAWLNQSGHHLDEGTFLVDLSLDSRSQGEHTVVRIAGEIDVYTAPKLREALIDLVNDGHYHLIIDVEGVEFLDSTGLGVLVGGLKRVRAHNGSLAVVCTQERLLKIFRITGLTKVFSIRESVDAALTAN
jgi:anti-sigma B factor antagonist